MLYKWFADRKQNNCEEQKASLLRTEWLCLMKSVQLYSICRRNYLNFHVTYDSNNNNNNTHQHFEYALE